MFVSSYVVWFGWGLDLFCINGITALPPSLANLLPFI